jgi:hypothetical protein
MGKKVSLIDLIILLQENKLNQLIREIIWKSKIKIESK